MDIFACSMAKKGAAIARQNQGEIFACSMGKKSTRFIENEIYACSMAKKGAVIACNKDFINARKTA